MNNFRGWLSVALLCTTGPVLAQDNLAPSPGFDTGYDGWTISTAEVAWVDADRNGASGSGAIQVTDPVNSRSVNGGPSVCIPSEAGTDIETGVWTLVDTEQREGVRGNMALVQYTSPNCEPGTARLTSYANKSFTPGEWSHQFLNIRVRSDIQSVRMSLYVYVADSSTTPVQARFDDAYYYEVAFDQYLVDPSLTGAWFNADQSGHGLMINMIDSVTVWMCWYAFDNEGAPAWICGLGYAYEDRLIFSDMFTIEGGLFPPEYDADQTTQVPWGRGDIQFESCSHGVFTWRSDEVLFGTGSMPIQRIAPTWGLPCLE
ncbi:hypothetical protein F3N42_13665 [Marinihelvus fidelis]|uniref:LamG domain-containing protein n=1 Tax=Marinihelvus fidelis TaxID=2613842 RepID=A0A5N0TA51_9GAMM|nr:hypothetical protein [Marinihelvus fidelis]KAA9130209.1 hypothetical protein F3N42_13665 [Marinihelvus fidelis]